MLYDYRQTRGGKNAVDFLGDYSGYVVYDGYDGYNRLTRAKRCGCFAYVRRKFVEAQPTDKELWDTSSAAEGVRRCDRLFALEREYDGKDKDGKQIREPLSPEEKHRRCNYALNENRYLYGFLANPGMEISNNRAENAIRPFVVGRKNWLFSDTEKGADASARCCSIIEQANLNGLNVFGYLSYLLTELPKLGNESTNEQLDKLLPWSETQPDYCKIA